MEVFKVAFVGDTSLGENYQEQAESRGGENILKTRGRDYTLGGVAPFLTASDLVIANLETPFTSLKHSPFVASKKYVHWSDVEESPRVLRCHNVAAVSLANNHTLDYGAEGLTETLAVLERQGIARFGAGSNAAEARRPFTRDITIEEHHISLAVIGAFEYRRSYKRLLAFYAGKTRPGANRLTADRIGRQVEELKRDVPGLFLVVFPHWGRNYAWRSPEQEELGHVMIDAGADLVLGHGAHMMGELELYRGKYILYSVGNFVFNAPGSYQGRRAPPYSFAAQVLFQSKDDNVEKLLRLYPLFSDNRETGFRPRFVTAAEMEGVATLLSEKSPPLNEGALGLATDEIGRYLEISLH